MRTGLILVGAGSARRMGGIDKIWEPLGERPLLLHSVDRLRPHVDWCVVVVREDQRERAERALADFDVRIVAGGAERQDSVASGLRALAHADAIAVHDVARPFASPRLLDIGFACLRTADGAIPAVAVSDTVKRVDAEGIVLGTTDRTELRAVQTPQAFRTTALAAAHEAATLKGLHGTDDAQLLEVAGFSVVIFPGDETNFKITTPHDLARARLLLENGSIH